MTTKEGNQLGLSNNSEWMADSFNFNTINDRVSE
jgi:hypothetical protein